jgi:hypothetical protein
MAPLKAFDGLLIDLRQFLRLREAPSDKALAVASLRAIGFEIGRSFPVASGLAWFQRTSGDAEMAVEGIDGRGAAEFQQRMGGV